jgi:hypothetical protein
MFILREAARFQYLNRRVCKMLRVRHPLFRRAFMVRYSSLPNHIREALAAIEPSRDGDLLYYPCRAVLGTGEVFENVYVVSEEPYFKYWGVYPENDRAKHWIRVEDVKHIENSDDRLPAQFANELYENGESGMGYTIFTVVFADGEKQACVTGNAVDFIHYPAGKTANDVVAVIPHEGRRDDSLVKGPRYYWCLYSEGL